MDIPKGFAPNKKDPKHLQYFLREPTTGKIPVVSSVDEFPEATNLLSVDGKLFLVSNPDFDFDPRMEEKLNVFLGGYGTRVREYKSQHLKRPI